MAEKSPRLSAEQRIDQQLLGTAEERILQDITGEFTVREGQKDKTLDRILFETRRVLDPGDKGWIPDPSFLLPPITEGNVKTEIRKPPFFPTFDSLGRLFNQGIERVINIKAEKIKKKMTMEDILMAILMESRTKQFTLKNIFEHFDFLEKLGGSSFSKEGMKDFFARSLARDRIKTDVPGRGWSL